MRILTFEFGSLSNSLENVPIFHATRFAFLVNFVKSTGTEEMSRWNNPFIIDRFGRQYLLNLRLVSFEIARLITRPVNLVNNDLMILLFLEFVHVREEMVVSQILI